MHKMHFSVTTILPHTIAFPDRLLCCHVKLSHIHCSFTAKRESCMFLCLSKLERILGSFVLVYIYAESEDGTLHNVT